MKEEFKKIIESNTVMHKIKKATVMITGVTGTIGSYILNLLDYYNKTENGDIKFICPVRNPEKAKDKYFNVNNVQWVKYDLNSEIEFDFSVDYVIHCAAPTRSADMVQKPTETIDAVFNGTYRLLKYFKEKGGKGFLYVSSVEIYGDNFDASKIFSENTIGALDTLNVRSSYPEAKRLAENCCVAFAKQYDLPIKIVRLSQILGVGDGDNRLTAYLCDCAKNKKPIVLKSDGKATKAYCYIADCVSAMLYVLIKGENTAYNVANKTMALSVYELAKFVSQKYLDGNVTVENKENAIYPKSSYLVLNTDKLCALGWQPIYGLDEAFDGLMRK